MNKYTSKHLVLVVSGSVFSFYNKNMELLFTQDVSDGDPTATLAFSEEMAAGMQNDRVRNIVRKYQRGIVFSSESVLMFLKDVQTEFMTTSDEHVYLMDTIPFVSIEDFVQKYADAAPLRYVKANY